MAKDSSPQIVPVGQSAEIHPKGLLEAGSFIEQNFANEMGGCMIPSHFLTTKQRLEFMEVGFRSSFISGLLSALLSPIAIGVIEKYIPMFGDANPTIFDTFSAFLLALGFSLGYSLFIAKTCMSFALGYTKAMVMNLFGGMAFGAIAKAVVAFIAFHFIYFKLFSDKVLLWAVGKLYYAKVSKNSVANIYYWLQGFKGVFLTSAYFILVTTLIFILIPAIAMFFAWRRNKKLIAAGILYVSKENS